MKTLIIISVLLLLSNPLIAQLNGWDLLSDVEIVEGFDDFMNQRIDKPNFSELLIEKEGKSMSLKGYIIPLEKTRSQDYFVLSRFPYQSCFFCGGAGPETVIEVFAKEKIDFTEDRVSVTGTLRLNGGNPLELFYTLENSEVKKVTQ